MVGILSAGRLLSHAVGFRQTSVGYLNKMELPGCIGAILTEVALYGQ